jgi:hypothetical protein
LSSPISLNPYAYANNNPINNTDPSGYMTMVENAVTITGIGALLYFIGYAGYVFQQNNKFGINISPDSLSKYIPDINGILLNLKNDISDRLSNPLLVINAGNSLNPFISKPAPPNPIPFPFPNPRDILPPIFVSPSPEQGKQKPLINDPPDLGLDEPLIFPETGSRGIPFFAIDDYPLEDLEELTGIQITDPIARKMANGHPFEEHASDFENVKDRLDFAQEIEYIISNHTESKV